MHESKAQTRSTLVSGASCVINERLYYIQNALLTKKLFCNSFRYPYCFEVGRITGRTYLFCSDRKEVLSKWTRGLMQAIVPPHVQNSMKNDMEYDRIGKLWMKSQHWAKKSSVSLRYVLYL